MKLKVHNDDVNIHKYQACSIFSFSRSNMTIVAIFEIRFQYRVLRSKRITNDYYAIVLPEEYPNREGLNS